MKHFRLFVLFVLLCVALPDASAQVSVRRGGGSRSEAPARREKKKKKSDNAEIPEAPVVAPAASPATPQSPATPAPARRVTPKAKAGQQPVGGTTQRQLSFDEYQRQDDNFKPWQHVVYRELDLTREANASLYYPTEPQDGLTNLFRVIFEGFCQNTLKGYEYMDGREIFTEKYVVKVQDVLDKFSIYYQQKPGVGQNAQPIYVVDEMDVPSNEVLKYYIKERWEFDLQTSTYGPRILAICPVVLRSGDFGGDAVPYPMCWFNYEDLRPLLRQHLVMSQGMNNTPRFTMEEYFTLEQYEGDIYKVQNVRGLSLMQQYPNADTLQIMREQIERQLRNFGDSIWVHEATDEELAAQDSIRAERRAERHARRGDGDTARGSRGKRNRRTRQEVDMEAVEDAQDAHDQEIDQRVEQTGTAHSARRRR